MNPYDHPARATSRMARFSGLYHCKADPWACWLRGLLEKTMKTVTLIAVLATLLGGGLAVAQTVDIEGVKFEPTAQVGGQALVLNGAGLRTRAFFKVYAAGLYVPEKSNSPTSCRSVGLRPVPQPNLRSLSVITLAFLICASPACLLQNPLSIPSTEDSEHDDEK